MSLIPKLTEASSHGNFLTNFLFGKEFDKGISPDERMQKEGREHHAPLKKPNHSHEKHSFMKKSCRSL
jgi:hypothetical protein